MTKHVFFVAAAGLVLTGPLARADFLFRTTRFSIITSGMFAGDNTVELDVMNDGNNGTGTTVLAATVTFESYAINPPRIVPGQFFVRTYDGDGTGLHNGGNPSSDPTDNDMGVSGVGGEMPLGTSARFGSLSQWTLAGSSPTIWSKDDPEFSLPGPGEMEPPNYPSSGKYADGQVVAGPITVIGGANLTSGGVNDTTYKPLAFAVVPAGQEVVFDVNVAGSQGPAYVGPSIGDPLAPVLPFPEPAGLGLLGLGALAPRARRR